ncbi:UDP-N-acetylmuramate dehydrogenase [Hyphobacterium marinum]|uniref:UDP-N-acetylenolpyruvoylglucosamine reductase n=1 Tax=Hyphobacterium marinum TaxID=3116574 RepID=A0ABU7LWX9_9PROT|nr:UDP-N-acetylmuramate dehydrogenase [Hyphobacterium sp. Y6023]MEE2566051.1 UDP-N-acetylmuramate dehydrogenase [Hyphobacterium sp. Y6023]
MTLLTKLPPVRGKYIENAPLGDVTWLRVGGPADVMFLPADEADLARFLAETPDEIPVTVLGAGSNVLVRDGGVRGVVVRLSAAFGKVEPISETRLRAGAAALDKKVAQAAARAGIAGLEFFVGIPGAIGGALRMNAGCYDRETKDVLVEAVALDRAGRRIIVQPEELGYAYRHSDAPDDWIFTEAVFEGEAGNPEDITSRMNEISQRRESTQPIRERTSGSTFKNPDPPGTPDQRKAWKLIDEAGWRGKRIGGARFSEMHANFLINDGTATAADLEAVVEGARADIKKATGIDLHWEVKRLGEPAR